ncbi:MAG: hypothetical protein PHH47_13040 [Gallionella sp.]|nr:hypothetical protein [Gallionella sp.]MDD4947435.1 hypothetical protein [Gallionella sp.]MDD5612444.1 hypothetical protein [Gallionella sp.]
MNADWPAVNPELLRSLPPVLAAVVRALGFGRAGEFLMEHGGVNVTIPKRRSTALQVEAGELQLLRETLAPHMDAAGRVWLPKPDKLFQRVRNEQIRRDKYHTSINSQARQHRLSSRQIQNIRREGDDRQFDLFG